MDEAVSDPRILLNAPPALLGNRIAHQHQHADRPDGAKIQPFSTIVRARGAGRNHSKARAAARREEVAVRVSVDEALLSLRLSPDRLGSSCRMCRQAQQISTPRLSDKAAWRKQLRDEIQHDNQHHQAQVTTAIAFPIEAIPPAPTMPNGIERTLDRSDRGVGKISSGITRGKTP